MTSTGCGARRRSRPKARRPRFEVASYNCGGPGDRVLANYFLMARPGNPLFARCHRLFLALWASDGGRMATEGMHASPLLRGVPMMGRNRRISIRGRRRAESWSRGVQ